MPINKETIISVFDDKLTLMQWLKTINKALEDAVLTGVEITKKGNATLSFKFTFEDGTYLETNDLVLQQGESVVNAFIQNGHLYLTLSNGTNLDAGNVKPVSNFSIDNNQHLIVNYADGTSQDLGAIFNGDIDINGTLTANVVDGTQVTGNEIVEKMSGYSFNQEGTDAKLQINNYVYCGAVKNGNKLSLVLAVNITRLDDLTSYSHNHYLGKFNLPSAVASKIYPSYNDAWFGAVTGIVKCVACSNNTQAVDIPVMVSKNANSLEFYGLNLNDLTLNTNYYLRIEVTFLLNDSLAQ